MTSRKDLIAAYKDRKVQAGLYALRCGPSGQVWVGQTADLDKIGNQLRFSLRMGNHPNRDLQTAWTAHGEATFTQDILEVLDGDDAPATRSALITERAAHWRRELGAAAV